MQVTLFQVLNFIFFFFPIKIDPWIIKIGVVKVFIVCPLCA